MTARMNTNLEAMLAMYQGGGARAAVSPVSPGLVPAPSPVLGQHKDRDRARVSTGRGHGVHDAVPVGRGQGAGPVGRQAWVREGDRRRRGGGQEWEQEKRDEKERSRAGEEPWVEVKRKYWGKGRRNREEEHLYYSHG